MLICTWLSSLAVVCAWFVFAYGYCRKRSHYSLVDLFWALGFLPVLSLYLWKADKLILSRTLAVAVPLTLWSLRLAYHLWKRLYALHPREDGRYENLLQRWGEKAGVNFFFFFQAQGISIAVLAVPFLLITQNPGSELAIFEIAGCCLALLSLAGESLADHQLNAFKQQPQNKGKTCQEGLWGLSRHPNYFFEWLMWCGYALMAFAAPGGVAGLIAPSLILYTLLRVTGIPATEAQALRTRGAEYQAYQARVSAFVPWFPKKTH